MGILKGAMNITITKKDFGRSMQGEMHMKKNKSYHNFKTFVVRKSGIYAAFALISAASLLIYGLFSCAGFLFSGGIPFENQNDFARVSLESTVPSLGESGARQNIAKNFLNALIGFDISSPKTILYSQLSALKIADAHAADAQITKNASQPAAPAEPAEDEGERFPIVETSSIVGGISNTGSNKSIYINNETSFDIDIDSLLREPLSITKQDGPLVLIVHTHTTESYTPSGQHSYSPNESTRTQDKNFNVVHVGDEIANRLTEAGINVIHDSAINDYPSYNGSYKKTLGVIESYLNQYPSIQVVLDVHRDGMTGSDGTKYKVTADIGGEKSSQVMILCGSSEGGLSHPNWRENLKLGLRIQDVLTSEYNGLARPLHLVKERYNQHASLGSMIIEVGTDGNTLEEALVGAKYTGIAIAKVLKEL